MFVCSRKFSAGKTQKGVFHLLSNRIFRKHFVNGKQPLFVEGIARFLLGKKSRILPVDVRRKIFK